MQARSKSLPTVAVFFFFLALAIVFAAPISLSPGDVAANDGDPLHISWILAWDAHQLPRNPSRLFESNAFFPYHSSLAFSEHFVGLAILAAPVFYLSGNALLAQNVALLLTLALSGTAMYLLFSEVFERRDAAVVAGLVYVFHTYNFHEVPRFQLLSIQWMALALLYLHRSFVIGGRRNAWLFGLFFLLHGLSCTYYLFYFALMLAFWIPAYALFSENGLRRAAALAPPLAIAGAVFGLLAIPYLRMLREFGFQRPLAEGLDLLEYFRPPEGSVFHSLVSFDLPPSVVPQFLGFLTLAVAALGIATWRARGRRSTRLFFVLSMATGLVGFVLSLGPTIRVAGEVWGTGPYAWLYDTVPLFRVLRNAERMSVLVHYALAIAAGLGASAVFSRLSRPPLTVAKLAIPVLLFYEHFTGGHAWTPVPTGSAVPEVYRWLAKTEPGEAVVELPLYPRAQLRRHAVYLFYSTYHFRPVVFGRTSFYPPLTPYLAWEMRDFPGPEALGLLEGLGVDRVVVHPKLWPPEVRGAERAKLQEYADRLAAEGTFPPLSGAVYDAYGFGEEQVFRLPRSGQTPDLSNLCTPSDAIDPAGWKLRGDGIGPPEWAVDRNPETKWKTDRQLPGLKLEIDLGREELVSAVRLTLAYPYDEFPRDLTLKAAPVGEGFERVSYRRDLATKWELVESLLHEPLKAAVTLRFEPTRVRRLRFWIREGKEFDYALPDWSLPELYLYRSCDVESSGSETLEPEAVDR